jgi:heterotetrameric sarcosine oxidase delta subunit
MLITCPYCGPRDLSEFTYQGDANRSRPDQSSTDTDAWNDYVYGRINTAGDHREYWQHSGGCGCHIVLTRGTVTHAISDVAMVPGAARRSDGGAPGASAGKAARR